MNCTETKKNASAYDWMTLVVEMLNTWLQVLGVIGVVGLYIYKRYLHGKISAKTEVVHDDIESLRRALSE